jgi:hypothetical protein
VAVLAALVTDRAGGGSATLARLRTWLAGAAAGAEERRGSRSPVRARESEAPVADRVAVEA